MSKPVPEGKRLTWDPAWPAPFESLWSVVGKVVALNNISWHELTTLIKRRDLGSVQGVFIDSAHTEWIDFSRFGALLGVAPSRLMQGCWDRLGLATPGSGSAIRICPQCWGANLYHCIFFNLSALSECPWHKCALSSACSGCSSPISFSIRNRNDLPPARFCARCRRAFPGISDLIAAKPMPSDRAKFVRRHCQAFLDWWDLLGARFPARDVGYFGPS